MKRLIILLVLSLMGLNVVTAFAEQIDLYTGDQLISSTHDSCVLLLLSGSNVTAEVNGEVISFILSAEVKLPVGNITVINVGEDVVSLPIKFNGDESLLIIYSLWGDEIIRPFETYKVGQTIVSTHDQNNPGIFSLNHNYPNPFNSTTNINYYVDQKTNVYLTVHNIRGQLVEMLFNGEQTPGNYTITWNATNSPSGVYFARLQSSGGIKIIKMYLAR